MPLKVILRSARVQTFLRLNLNLKAVGFLGDELQKTCQLQARHHRDHTQEIVRGWWTKNDPLTSENHDMTFSAINMLPPWSNRYFQPLFSLNKSWPS